MEKGKCITFDKAAQDSLPEHIKAKMKADRAESVKLAELKKGVELIKSGYAGVLSTGEIVDRREHAKATPIRENPLLGTPKPKAII